MPYLQGGKENQLCRKDVQFTSRGRWIWAEDIYEVLDCRMGLSENADLDFKYFDTSNKIRYRIPYHCSFFSCSGC